MKIKAHKLDGVEFLAANACGGEMRPTLVVLHDTAGRLEPKSSVNWFCSEDCNTSAHVVVERDGSMTQLVHFNRKAWHAGASSWQGKTGCNAFAIGIEIVNPGILGKDGRAWFHKKTEKGFTLAGLRQVKTASHGDGCWMPYTAEQIETVTNLCKALCGAYPEISDVTAHFVISPGRKIDVNPLFPLAQVRHAALSVRNKEEPEAAPEIAPALGQTGTIPAADAPNEPPQEKASILSDRNFSKLNELADQGSRIAQWLRAIKRWFWGGSTVIGGGAATLANTSSGTKSAFMQIVHEHPLLFVAVAGCVLAVLVYFGIKAVERFLLTAAKDGRYQPRGTA